MSEVSPFTTIRFEYEPKHLYYLPPSVFSLLEAPQPTYIVGSRGTGKTTLLRALHWEERLTNASLQRQIGENPFRQGYIGLYLKLPEIQLAAFDAWLQADEPVYAPIMGLYLDLVWVGMLFAAIGELLARGIFDAPTAREHETADRIARHCASYLGRHLPPRGPHTFVDLASAVQAAKQELEHLALGKADRAQTMQLVPLVQPGALGRFVSTEVAGFLDAMAPIKGGNWHFKVCMDEAECLSPPQQRVLNTVVRLCSWPSFLVASFVSFPVDATGTVVPSLTLGRADRQLLVLDDMGDSAFKELAQGVATVRLQEQMAEDDLKFDIDAILGRLDLNALLADILNESVQPEAKEWLRKAECLADDPSLAESASNGDPAESAGEESCRLPIYQAYLVDRLNPRLPSPEDPRWEHRRQESGEIRKRMVAAYLSLCSELGVFPRYASSDMLMQMSDHCMRDFLLQLEQVFRHTGKGIRDFLKMRVPMDTQNVALRKASLEKRASLPRSGVAAPEQTGRVVTGLAMLTAALQTGSGGTEHLRLSERGVFEVRWREAELMGLEPALDIVREAAEAGFLRLLQAEGSTVGFRVHTSLAAAYGFSYRGAYYPCRLSLMDIEALSKCVDSRDLDAAVKAIARRLSSEKEQTLSLFEGEPA
jgi:hypothetical protein